MALTKAQQAKLKANKSSMSLQWTPTSKIVFKSLPGNREVNNKHISTLRRLISEYGMLTTPLMVATKAYNKKGDDKLHLYTLDGQHRVEACVRDNVPFDFKVIRIEDVETIVQLMADLNNSSKGWKLDDYINAFAFIPAVMEHYTKLMAFTKKHDNYTTSICCNLLHFGNLNARQSDMVKSGKFEYTYEKEALEALAIFDYVSVAMGKKADKDIKVALRSINFRAALLDFLKDNKENLVIETFIKGFAKNLISVQDLPSTATEWRLAMNKYYSNNKNKPNVDFTKVTEELFA